MSGPKRKRSEDALLLALAGGATVGDAARTCGVSERTAYRRLADPEFKRQLAAVRAEVVGRTAGALTAAGVEAVATLLDLLKAGVAPATRLGAAKAVLEVGLRLREVVDLEARIAELEAKLDAAEAAPTQPTPWEATA